MSAMISNKTGEYLLAHSTIEHNDPGFGNEVGICDLCKKNPWIYSAVNFGIEVRTCHECGNGG